ncbi:MULTISPECIES: sucrose-6-phosphate hydrolase [Clostridium]|uniref:Sucrose-6-phosphate hydrolase n=1 Tax=Clostridium cibarium TaxID=2762247 RepID=A0ABR8PUS9_9CLOT|nr:MULTISPECIES: sucrose-6-phosphate hydrolase [Clostridium]MBD7911938.1 sucrose-6-phosphate hydrolase [Clostridium cibarium]
MGEFKSLEDINLDVVNSYKNSSNNDLWKLNYHIEAPFGLVNDPNGLCYYDGEYYIFFQWNPYGCEHKFKHWALVKTKDFVNFTMPKAVLAPNDWYDKNGCYSGSGIVVDGKLELLYTGNVKDDKGNRESYQCRATCDKEGNITKLGPVIPEIPKGYTAHFRDPKVYKKGDVFYCVIGAQNEELKGRVILYSSEDFKSWKLEGEIGTKYKEFGYMWECPSAFELDGNDILVFSPQGLEKEEFKNQNIYQSGYIIGNLNYDTLNFDHCEFKELDMGFDFYAPQCFKDDNGRNLMIGWMGLPEEEDGHPTRKFGRIHCLTMVRELSIREGVLYQRPIEEFKNLRKELIVDLQNVQCNEYKFDSIRSNSYELLLDLNRIDSSKVELKFALGKDEHMSFKYDFESGIAIIDRSNMLEGDKGIRKFKLLPKDNIKIQMFMDTSACEIYLQDGLEVASSRIYPKEDSFEVKLISEGGSVEIHKAKVWNLEGVKYNE